MDDELTALQERVAALEAILFRAPATSPRVLALLQRLKESPRPVGEPRVLIGPFFSRDHITVSRSWWHWLTPVQAAQEPRPLHDAQATIYQEGDQEPMVTIYARSRIGFSAPGVSAEALRDHVVPLLLRAVGCVLLTPENEEVHLAVIQTDRPVTDLDPEALMEALRAL